MKNNYELMAPVNSAPIKMWTQGVPVEPEAREQLLNTAKMPFIFKHLAVMPDVHLGKGSTIGNYSGGRWRGYWLRHDCGAYFAGGVRPAG